MFRRLSGNLKKDTGLRTMDQEFTKVVTNKRVSGMILPISYSFLTKLTKRRCFLEKTTYYPYMRKKMEKKIKSTKKTILGENLKI